MLLNTNKRNEILIECIKVLRYLPPEQIEKIKSIQSDLDSFLLEKNIITEQQKTILHYFFTYYCLLYSAKHHGCLNDSQVKTLIQNKCCGLSEGKAQIDLNYLEKQILKNNGKQIIDSLCDSKILTMGEHKIVTQWATDDQSKDNDDLKQIGHYKISSLLGTGGMGKVYKAYHPVLQKTVAIKVLLQLKNVPPKIQERFFAEARMMSQLKHPNIVSVYDLGVEDGISFIVMDFIEGLSLKQYLQKSKVSWRKTCQIMLEVATAVDYAHKHNIVHRDLKPGNLMVDNNNHIWLMDFGLAKNTRINNDLTNTGQVLGTPKYMSPEQANGDSKNVTHLSDVYSLGIIFYEMLTGVCPIQGNTHSKVIYNILHQEVKTIRFYNKNIPSKLEAICLKAMQKQANHRYQSAQQMANDIDNFLQGKSVSARHSVVSHHVQKNRQKYVMAALVSIIIVISISFGMYVGKENHNNVKKIETNKNLVLIEKQETSEPKATDKKELKNEEKQETSKLEEIIEATEEEQNETNNLWKQWSVKKFGLSYLVKPDWKQTFYKKEPNFLMVNYDKKNTGSIVFFFGKVLHDDLENAIHDIEEEIWPTKLGFVYPRTKEMRYKFNEFKGKKIHYRLTGPKKKKTYEMKTFYSLDQGYFLGIIVAQNANTTADPKQLIQSMHSLKKITTNVIEKKGISTETCSDIIFEVNTLWSKKVIKQKVGENILYSSARHFSIQFISRKKSSFVHLDNFITNFENKSMDKKYNYTMVNKQEFTINSIKGILVTYSFKLRTISMHAEHFYAFHKGHHYAVCAFVPKEFQEKKFSEIKKAMLSIRPSK